MREARWVVIIGMVIVLCGVIFVAGFYFSNRNSKEEHNYTPVEVKLPAPADGIDDGVVVSPIDKNNLADVRLEALDYGREDLIVRLPAGSKFFAGIGGRVNLSGQQPQQVMEITSKDGQQKLRYYFLGRAVVEKGQMVTAGEEVGRIGEDNLPSRDVNLIVQYHEGGKGVSFTPEMIEGWKDE